MGRLLPVAHHDPDVAAALIRVIGMLERPSQLMAPRTLWRVLRDHAADAHPVPVGTSAR